jgi:hypothetical protein
MENMEDRLEIQSDASSDAGLDIIAKKKNYTSLKAHFDGSHGCRLPCLYKAPQSGEHSVLNLLLVYLFNSGNSKLHRIIKISVKIPLANCLKLNYATLKLLNAKTYIGLLRLHNLTPVSYF